MLGNQRVGISIPEDNSGKGIIRDTAHPARDVRLDLAGDNVCIAALNTDNQVKAYRPSQAGNGRQLAHHGGGQLLMGLVHARGVGDFSQLVDYNDIAPQGGTGAQTVVVVQGGAGHAEPLAGIGEQLQPPLQLCHQPAQHGQGIFSGDAEGAIAITPARGVVLTAFEVYDVYVHRLFARGGQLHQALLNENSQQGRFPAASRAAHEPVGHLVEVGDDGAVVGHPHCNLRKGYGEPGQIDLFRELGITSGGIRIDSGDLTYLSKRARKMLDNAGLPGIKIVASNSLDEYIIRDLLTQGAQIDAFGVGERLITSKSEPVFGGVYKLAAIEEEDGSITPKIKISENAAKVTLPHFKRVYRLFSNATGKAMADYICVHDERPDFTQPLELFDPEATWKRKTVSDLTARPLLAPIFQGGRLVYQIPTIQQSRAYCQREVDNLWDEVKRFEFPHNYYVDLSQKLWDVRAELLAEKH